MTDYQLLIGSIGIGSRATTPARRADSPVRPTSVFATHAPPCGIHPQRPRRTRIPRLRCPSMRQASSRRTSLPARREGSASCRHRASQEGESRTWSRWVKEKTPTTDAPGHSTYRKPATRPQERLFRTPSREVEGSELAAQGDVDRMSSELDQADWNGRLSASCMRALRRRGRGRHARVLAGPAGSLVLLSPTPHVRVT